MQVKPVEQDIPEIYCPCLRRGPSLSLDFGVPRQGAKHEPQLGGGLVGVKLNPRIQQKITVTIDWIALQVLTYVQGKHKP
jgi:hypothetical protein